MASFPAGQFRTITIDLLAACIAFGKASFTFLFHGNEEEVRNVDNVAYGKWESKIYSTTYISDIKAWLLDSDACLTEYDVLLTLRQQHTTD